MKLNIIAKKSAKPAVCLALILITTFATGCESSWSDAAGNSNIYQASILRIPPQTTIKTSDGNTYTSQSEETWYSSAEYEKIEKLYFEAIGK